MEIRDDSRVQLIRFGIWQTQWCKRAMTDGEVSRNAQYDCLRSDTSAAFGMVVIVTV